MPDTVDDIVISENECAYVDFKKEFCIYRSPHDKCDFLKDVMAFANSSLTDEKYIIYGVDLATSPRKIVGIAPSDLPDQALIQEFIRENIEPDLGIECFVHDHKGINIGVIRIFNCIDRPYTAKKDFHETQSFGIRAGDSYIRVGSRKDRLLRRDIDAIVESKLKKTGVKPEIIDAIFSDTGDKKLLVRPYSELRYPSMLEREKIEGLIENAKVRQQNESRFPAIYATMDYVKTMGLYNQDPYSGLSVSELEQKRDEVATEFREDDLYFLFEENGLKLSITIINNGNCFVEDASIVLELPDIPGLSVAERIHHRPDRSPFAFIGAVQPIPPWRPTYPRVSKQNGKIRMEAAIGDIKQTIPTQVFAVPPRIAAGGELSGRSIEMELTLIGRNVPEPIRKKLVLSVQ